jgi:hypothetical protein
MNSPKQFEEYIAKGIIRKISPDKSRAEFLANESVLSLEGLKDIIEKIGIDEKNANSIIKECYDIMMELIRAKLLLKGYNSSGQYAHEAEVAYARNLGLNENEISFLNELRYSRNSAIYYGKIFSTEYAKKVFDFLNKILGKLK